jgi:hypothetical protein
MKRSFKYRAHEWAADKFSWVQYPNVRAQSANAKVKAVRFQHAMPIGKRLDVAIFSFALLLVAVAVLGVVGIIGWALISSAFR